MAYRKKQSPHDWRLARQQVIVTKLRAFHSAHKRSPTSPELGCGAKEERVRELPCYDTIARYFGSVANALLAAGLTPRSPGDRIRPATRVGTSKDTIRRRLAREAQEEVSTPPRERRYIASPDFALIFKEARAELARMDSLQPRFYVQGNDPHGFALSSLKRPRRRSA